MSGPAHHITASRCCKRCMRWDPSRPTSSSPTEPGTRFNSRRTSTPKWVCRLADVVHHPNNLAASISSGSFLFDGPLVGAHLPLHVRSELCGGLPGELLHRRRVRESDPAPEGVVLRFVSPAAK